MPARGGLALCDGRTGAISETPRQCYPLCMATVRARVKNGRLVLEFTDDAREQVRVASTWWRENRQASPTLFEDKLAAAVGM
jgi:hypothetical protein